MTFPSRTLSISIDRPPDKVYDFILNPENLPKWAAGLCKSVRKANADWIAETPQGPMKIRFAEKNDFRVLDHYVNPAPGVEVYVPMRVLPNGSGSEVIFTIVRSPDMSDDKFAEDIGLVERDLRTLKNVLERN
jgi:carbon monoxide dehydrogenase subunit G